MSWNQTSLTKAKDRAGFQCAGAEATELELQQTTSHNWLVVTPTSGESASAPRMDRGGCLGRVREGNTLARYSIGDYQDHFSIQSTSKPFTYALALNHMGAEVICSANSCNCHTWPKASLPIIRGRRHEGQTTFQFNPHLLAAILVTTGQQTES